MTTKDAIKILANVRHGDRYEAALELASAVLEVSEYGDPDDSLVNWISAGDYNGNETVANIVKEWEERAE